VPGTDAFVDCDGRELTTDDLARDEALCPIVEERETIAIGLRRDVCGLPPKG
jgi:hypothetical protein